MPRKYTPDARAHYNEYAPAETQLSAIASKWAAYPLTGLPDPGFIDAINHTKTAANFAADGMATKQKLLTVDDAALITQLQNDRSTMATEALAASRALTAIAAKYNFSLALGVHE